MNLIGPASRERFSPRFRRLLAVSSAISLAVIALAYISLPRLGKWLVREDPIQKADAIAVLSGKFPQRALEAARLYRNGYAPEVWLTDPKHGYRGGAYASPQPANEETRNFQLLLNFGVPPDAIHVLDLPIVNTADELNAIDDGLKETGVSSVIIVTNKAHTRRVYSLWKKYHAGDGEIVIHAVARDQFSPSHWWTSPSMRTQGIHEILGMMDLWAGLPVHSAGRS